MVALTDLINFARQASADLGQATGFNPQAAQDFGDYMYANNNGIDPQEMNLRKAQAQSIQADTAEKQRQQDVAQKMPAVLEALKDKSPDEVFGMLSPIVGVNDAYKYADMIRKTQAQSKKEELLGKVVGGEGGATDPASIAAAGAVTGDPALIQYAGFLQGQDKQAQAQKNREEDKKTTADNRAFDTEKNLRNEFVTQSKDFIQVRDAYSRISGAAKQPSAAGDLALIFNYMKILDPGSTVREGEFANAQNAGGVSDKVQAMYNNVLSGERLTENQRKDFLGQSKTLYSSMEKNQSSLEKRYKKLADSYGLKPERVIQDLRAEIDAEGNGQGAPLPQSAVADGLTQADWDSMTEEERALWH